MVCHIKYGIWHHCYSSCVEDIAKLPHLVEAPALPCPFLCLSSCPVANPILAPSTTPLPSLHPFWHAPPHRQFANIVFLSFSLQFAISLLVFLCRCNKTMATKNAKMQKKKRIANKRQHSYNNKGYNNCNNSNEANK